MSIKVNNLIHIYSEGLPYETLAIDDVSFHIDDGEFIGIIGHTGSGKSTLLQHLNGLLKPKSGQIFVGDVEITSKDIKLTEIRRRIGLVFQYPEYQLFEETVYLDVAFGPKNLGLSEEEIDIRVREALFLVGLNFDEFAQRSPFELSGGQKRRVAIAGVVAMKPEVLILDEPTAGLDPKSHQDILEMIKMIHETRRSIVILVSHNMDDIARLSNRVFVMNKGKLALSGTPEKVFSEGDFLESIGLSAPSVTEMMRALKKGGLPISDNILDIDEAERELDAYLKTRYWDISFKNAGFERETFEKLSETDLLKYD